MSIILSGDFHAAAAGELSTITKKNLLAKYGSEKYNGIKYQIILGDGGFMWPGNSGTDRYNYKALAHRPFPILCVIGNHEPILGMGNIPEVDIGIGEKVLLVNKADPFVAYLKRGKVYTIDGFKFLVLGGAMSVDKKYRKPGKTWWPQEYWSEKEKEDVFKLLETDNRFDCVLSHTGPQHINRELFEYRSSSYLDKIHDEVAHLNDDIHEKIQFRYWWCGHWHRDVFYLNPEMNHRYQYLYRTTQILDKVDNAMVVYDE